MFKKIKTKDLDKFYGYLNFFTFLPHNANCTNNQLRCEINILEETPTCYIPKERLFFCLLNGYVFMNVTFESKKCFYKKHFLFFLQMRKFQFSS